MIQKMIFEMMQENAGDEKRIEHALKVHAFVKTIAKGEGLDKKTATTLEIAAILHDIGLARCEQKYNSTNGQLQQIEGPPIALKILSKYTDDQALITRVAFLIAHHHTFKNVTELDHQILLEADLIVNALDENITQNALKKAQRMLFKTPTGMHIANSQFKSHA
jgi:uncharacterized protein